MGRDQRQDFVTYSSLLGYVMNTFQPSWSQRGYLTPEENDGLLKAIDILKGVSDSVMSRMDGDFRKVLYRDTKGLQIFTMPKERVQAVVDKYRENDTLIEVDIEILDSFAGVSLELCSRCSKTLEEQKDCILTLGYMMCGIEVFDAEAEGCPYKVPDDYVLVRHEFLYDYLKRVFKVLKEKGSFLELNTRDEGEPYSLDTSKCEVIRSKNWVPKGDLITKKPTTKKPTTKKPKDTTNES